jgi:hypothetical protein
MPTQELLELTIKINEFPDVQTGENCFKQFDIGTGEQIVTVALKPKCAASSLASHGLSQ